MVQETGVLMGEAVVVLLPDMRGKEIIERSNFSAPRQFRRHLQPFGVLTEHRIDDANESFVAVEQTVATREEVSFQPTLALVLAEHGIQHTSGGGEEFVIIHFPRVPLAVGDFEYRTEKI